MRISPKQQKQVHKFANAQSERRKSLSTTSNTSQYTVELLTYLWDECKYRHDMCWTAVLKVAATATALAVLPYVKPELISKIKYLMLVPPIIGTLLAVFGFFVVHNELKLRSLT